MIITDIKKLRQKSESITKQDYYQLMPLIEQELDKVKDRGIGLSAIQIGFNKRFGLIKFHNTRIELINPVIIEKFDRFRFQNESCLSLPELSIDTSRYLDITVENGFDKKLYCFYGIESVAVQHEIDHMNGKLIIDKKWRKRR